MEVAGTDFGPELRDDLARSWKGLMAAGVLAILVGCVAILVPAVASVATAIFIGWILIAAGAFMVVTAFGTRSGTSLLVRLFWAALTLFAGLYLVLAPLEGTVTLTFVLVLYFLIMGASRLGLALAGRGEPGAGLVALSGAASVLVGLLILADFPSSADWAIGLLVGIDLIFAGWSLTSLGLAGRELTRRS